MTDLEMYEQDTEPFTASEMNAILQYEEAVGASGLMDCFSGLDIRHTRWHESEFGQDETREMLREHAGMLNDWYLAIDTLLAEILTCTSEFTRYSMAALRYVKDVTAVYHRTRQDFEHMATTWLLALLENVDYPPPTRSVNVPMQTLSTEE